MGLQKCARICAEPSARTRYQGKEESPVDNQTRHTLKNDKFAQATASSMSWLSGHRSGVVRWVVAGVVALAVVVGGLIYWNVREAAGDSALGAALDVYNAPLLQPGAPPEQGSYTSATDRTKEANREFVAVSENFSWLPAGAKAHYFAGVTDQDLGQNGPAETELKIAAGSWDRNLSNLAKLALAELYHQTNRDTEAIAIYTALESKPSDTVSKAVAQLNLADLYAATGKQEDAKKLWAAVKDEDKDGAAGSIATRKLGVKE
jgi:tetratricopeptide (TPR) repeat protein